MELELPDGEYDGFLFDCDGTLVDSMPVHFTAWNVGLEAAGAPYRLSEEDFYGWGGIHEADIIGMLNERHGASVEPMEVIGPKAESFERGMASGLELIAPVVDLARAALGSKQMGVVSGSPRGHVEECLRATGIDGFFEAIVTPEDVGPGRGKPHPDMFHLLAAKLGVEPGRCLVFEDAQSGIDGALAAGMGTVFVPRDCR